MVRWSIIGIGATIAVVGVISIIWSRPSYDSPPTQNKADTTALESSEPAPAKPKAQEPVPPSVLVEPAQKEPTCDQVNHSDHTPIKLPVSQGPLKLLKGLYQDESRDATSGSIERRIRSQFDPKIFPLKRLHTVTCHESVCKIGVFWSEKEPMVLAGVAMNVHAILSTHLAFEPVTERDAKGDVLIEMYILRGGFELEDFE